MTATDYVIAVSDSVHDIDPASWNALLALQPDANPFMRHEYLAAMVESASATPGTGWDARFFALWHQRPGGARELHGACALYIKSHSRGEYVFDHAWANAYQQHGLAYYPKALVAPPFTPVPGARMLARDAAARLRLARALVKVSVSRSSAKSPYNWVSVGQVGAPFCLGARA